MKFESVKEEIATGDVFLFANGPSLFSRLIRARTESRYSHVGVAIWVVADSHKELAILEALEGVGVRLHPMGEYLEECAKQGCKVDWFRVTDRHIDREKVAAFALRQWGKKYASWARLALNFGALRRWFGFDAVTEPDRFFCSELVASALRYAGYRGEDGDPLPAETAPGWVALLPCLQRVGELK